MTAFDNIKTNNWPSASNEFEDFLVLKLPLNDQASLTESLPVNAGSQELFPKRTLTNTGVQSVSIGNRIWSSAFVAESSSTLPFRDGKTIASAFGPANSIIETATNQTGEVIYLDFANNGGALTGYSTIKFLGGGLNAGNRGVFLNGSSTSAGALDVGIDISGQTINNIQVKSVASNAGAAFAGIELDGVRLIDPSYRKHYANSAVFNGSTDNLVTEETAGNSLLSQDYTIECYINRLGNGSITAFETFFDTRITDTTAMPVFGTNSSGQIKSYGFPNGTGDQTHGSSGAVTNGTWHHVAASKQGNTHRIFLDGTQIYSTTSSNAPTVSTARYTIGRTTSAVAGNYAFNGSVQDVRVYKGVAKYTSNFTPPSAILG